MNVLPRVLRGYGPLVALGVVIVLMATLAPSVDRPVGTAGFVTTETSTVPGTPGTASDGSAPGAAATGTGGGSGGPTVVEGRRTAGGETGPCAGREKQVPGDPYSPPCVAFSGDNGGATHRGVTADEIVVSARILDERGFQETLAQLAGAEITDRPPDIKRTISALATYFNERFQFYGRQIEIAFYDGQGSSTTELLGGGQAEAQADAITVAQEIGAFAEIRGSTAPFTDALARQGVVAFGTPYLSREWHIDHRPYNWSIATDCSIITETVAELIVKQLAGKPASFAEGDLAGRERKVASLAPENPWYQECVEAGQRIAREAGHPSAVNVAYRLDIPSMSNQAAGVIARLKSEGVTTVLCGCDPIFPVFLSTKATEQDYHPEWIITGSAGTDLDIVGQLYDQDQWSRAFGVSYLGSFRPQRAGLGYAAYKTVRDDEPAFAVESIYGQMYLLAIGLQGAGPNLTPQTYEQGMFDYPGGTGPFGTWGFGPRSYTPTQDSRIIWWDPDGISPYNNERGTYREAYGGERFRPGSLPSGDPEVFSE